MTLLHGTMNDPEYERLKVRRILPVVNDPAQPTDAFVLESDAPQAPSAPVARDELTARVIAALRSVHDPEIPLNIYDLGLIYSLDVNELGHVDVRMTLTAPGCPVAGSLVQEVHEALLGAAGVRHARTELVWDPPWTRERMTEAAKLELGLL